MCEFVIIFTLINFSIEAQQYHVYTLQPLSNSTSALGSPLSQQQQEYIHEQQELKGKADKFNYTQYKWY